MARKGKNKRKKSQGSRTSWWHSMDSEARRRILLRSALVLAAALVIAAGAYGMGRLDDHVDARLSEAYPLPSLTFVDVPEPLVGTADEELRQSLMPFLDRPWMDDQLCREMAQTAGTSGWVRRVKAVRRLSDGRFEIRCAYRVPFAMVQKNDQFILVDHEGVRLPGSYRYDPAWLLVQGVGYEPPGVGEPWQGDDIKAGLSLVNLIREEAFARQVTAVLVDNFGGRLDPRQTHIELATDKAGGRIRWGSPPGRELEENPALRKLEILRRVYHETGRVDGGHAVIDVSVFPDRYIIVR